MKFIELLKVLTSLKVKLYVNCAMIDEYLIYTGSTSGLIDFDNLYENNVFQIIAPDCDGFVSIALEGENNEEKQL